MNVIVIKDFPKQGVNFIDIFSMLMDFENKIKVKEFLEKEIGRSGILLVPESRAFLLAGMFMSYRDIYIVPFRKKGKLPFKSPTDIRSVSYEKEYGYDTLECSRLHTDVIKNNPDLPIVVLDDVLATGSTATAMASLIETFSNRSVDKFVFLGEVTACNGRSKCENLAKVSTLFKL